MSYGNKRYSNRTNILKAIATRVNSALVETVNDLINESDDTEVVEVKVIEVSEEQVNVQIEPTVVEVPEVVETLEVQEAPDTVSEDASTEVKAKRGRKKAEKPVEL